VRQHPAPGHDPLETMTQEDYKHPIAPPPELAMQWIKQLFDNSDDPVQSGYLLIKVAAQYGADQELEACCEWLEDVDCDDPQDTAAELRAARRPEPPSLKERLSKAIVDGDERKALKLLEQLDD
jgi:hypothetical protein